MARNLTRISMKAQKKRKPVFLLAEALELMMSDMGEGGMSENMELAYHKVRQVLRTFNVGESDYDDSRKNRDSDSD